MAPNPVIKKEDGWYHADKSFITVDELTVRYEYKHGPFDSAKEAWEAFGKHINNITYVKASLIFCITQIRSIKETWDSCKKIFKDKDYED